MRKIKKIIFGIFLLGFIYLGFIYFMMFSNFQSNAIDNADTMIILGAKVKNTPAIPTLVLKERLNEAIIYLQNNKNTKVIVSGGQGVDESTTESSVMKKYLIDNGIDSQRIYEENESKRTAEQFVNSKKILDLKKTIVVTSEFHMYRSMMLAKQEDVDAYSLSSKTHLSSFFKAMIIEPLSITKAYILDLK